MGKKNVVKGVTSAAIIWLLAAIGAAIGLGLLAKVVALTLAAVGVLVGVELLESTFLKLDVPAETQAVVVLTCRRWERIYAASHRVW